MTFIFGFLTGLAVAFLFFLVSCVLVLSAIGPKWREIKEDPDEDVVE